MFCYPALQAPKEKQVINSRLVRFQRKLNILSAKMKNNQRDDTSVDNRLKSLNSKESFSIYQNANQDQSIVGNPFHIRRVLVNKNLLPDKANMVCSWKTVKGLPNIHKMSFTLGDQSRRQLFRLWMQVGQHNIPRYLKVMFVIDGTKNMYLVIDSY